MMDKIRVRVKIGEDGKSPEWDLIVDGQKICDLSFTEVLELSLQATSSLRWITEKLR